MMIMHMIMMVATATLLVVVVVKGKTGHMSIADTFSRDLSNFFTSWVRSLQARSRI
jgi:hypothetical protein